jgi:transposase-like protein
MTTDNTNPREERGKEIAKKFNQIKRITEKFYKVQSQSTKYAWYNVVATKFGWECTCADHTYRHVCCKHIHAVELSIKLRQKVLEENTTAIQPVIINCCLFCKSGNIKKYGIRKNRNYSIQRFVCTDCHKTFSENIGFEKLKHNPKGITTAIQLYFSGESLRNVAKSLRLLGMDVSHQAIYNWISKYTGLMEKYLDKIVPQVGETWRADEIFLKIKGDMKYLYAMMDDETRFWIAKQVADTKYTQDVRPMFEQAKETAQRKPEVLITDGAQNFQTAYRKEFQTWTLPRTVHIRHIHMKGDKNNNKMERLNGEIRDREKTMRGLKKMDSPLIEGYRIFHNYVRPHEGLEGQTPADKAGIKIGGTNKWITLIQNSRIKET